MVIDLDDVFDWTLNNISEYGGNPENVILVGHSAGNNFFGLSYLLRSPFSSLDLIGENQTTKRTYAFS
jgi:acetyl esterase/lipase